MKLLILITLVMKRDLHLCYRSFLNTATLERTSLYFVISFLRINIMKDKTSMTSSQNWKNLVHNVILKLSITLLWKMWLFVVRMIILWESVFFVNLNWLFPKHYLLVMLPKKLVNMPAKYLSQMRPLIYTRFQNTQNLEVKPSPRLQRSLKNTGFAKIPTTVVNVLPMEKFVITVTGKTILRSAVHVIEKLSTKLNKLKLSHLLLTNMNFFLIK